MVPKQLQFRPSPLLLKRMEEECEELGLTMPQLIEEGVRYFLDRKLYSVRNKEEINQLVIDSLQSTSGRLAISMALDTVLNERAKEKYGDEI